MMRTWGSPYLFSSSKIQRWSVCPCNSLGIFAPRSHRKRDFPSIRFNHTHPVQHSQGSKEQGRYEPPGWRRHLYLLGWLPVAAFFVGHVYSIANIKGGSMSPTLNPIEEGRSSQSFDLVLLNKWAAASQHLQIGDVVTLISPQDPSLLLTKRILALPGDVMTLRVPTKQGSFPPESKVKRVLIPENHVWVEGDVTASMKGFLKQHYHKNADIFHARLSRDSQEFGPVSMSLITARIDLVLWPPERFGRLRERENFDVKGAQMSYDLKRQRKDAGRSERLGTRAHPEDSSISPYTDWEWTKSARMNTGMGEEDGAVNDQTEKESDGELVPLSTAAFRRRRRTSGERAIDEKEIDADQEWERRWRQRWNSMSRGGTLGDDAGQDEHESSI